ncbi:MAG: hypothetical protein ACTSQP_01400 [Promethearchaeota archaeon]
MIKKRYEQNWRFISPDAVLTCSILNCKGQHFIAFGGHDRRLYLMDENQELVDSVPFDGWCRCTFPIDLDGDGCDELLAGAGDGNFFAFKVDLSKHIFIPIMNYFSKGKVLTCAAGDINRDGNIELIFGGEDKTLKILKNISSKKPIITLYYDSWVTCCAIGGFKHPEFQKPIIGLIVGTKSGFLEFIVFNKDKPNILWQKDLNSQINTIVIGDVLNNGYNEIIVGTNDYHIKILDCEGYKLKYINLFNSRPLALLVDDIDGNGANEIVVGCADGTLKVFRNDNIDSTEFYQKWQLKISTSIKTITSFIPQGKKIKEIIFGGYDRTLRDIYDYEYGKEPKLTIKPKILLQKIEAKPISTLDLNQNIPTTLQETITNFFEKWQYIPSLELLQNYLEMIGFSKEQIEKEINALKENKMLNLESKEINIWTYGIKIYEKEKIGEKESEGVAEEIQQESLKEELDKTLKERLEKAPKKAPKKSPKKAPKKAPKKSPKKLQRKLPRKVLKKLQRKLPRKAPKKLQRKLPRKVLKKHRKKPPRKVLKKHQKRLLRNREITYFSKKDLISCSKGSNWVNSVKSSLLYL